MNFEWTLFRDRGQVVAIPKTPVMVKLRRMIPDDFMDQPALGPLKRFLDGIFVAGPVLIIASLYLPNGAGLMVVCGIIALAIASLYWFAPHWLCTRYLLRSGFTQVGVVQAESIEAALETTP